MRKRNIKVLLSVTGLFVLLAAFIGYGLYRSACTLKVTTYALSSEKLSHAVRMVQLTDLHNSVFGENNAELVETVAEQQPDVILMDEPTSALDPISTAKVEDLAVELKKDYTIIIVTHNMQQAVRISDKTAFFLLGEVVEFGQTDQLFSMPQDKRTEDYITGRFG